MSRTTQLPRFQQRHYIELAALIDAHHIGYSEKLSLIRHFSDYFIKDNPKFKPMLFLKAATKETDNRMAKALGLEPVQLVAHRKARAAQKKEATQVVRKVIRSVVNE